LTVSQVKLCSFQLPTAMLDTKSLNTLLLEIVISFKHECVFICDLSDLTLEIIFDTWGASMNVGSKHSIAWVYSTHVPLGRFNLYCRIEETSSTSIICIICHQVLHHQSEHATSTMGKHLLSKAHIVKLNESTESENPQLTCSTVDATALGILNRLGSQGIILVCWQRKFIFDI